MFATGPVRIDWLQHNNNNNNNNNNSVYVQLLVLMRCNKEL
jgi:hypothetical protein